MSLLPSAYYEGAGASLHTSLVPASVVFSVADGVFHSRVVWVRGLPGHVGVIEGCK